MSLGFGIRGGVSRRVGGSPNGRNVACRPPIGALSKESSRFATLSAEIVSRHAGAWPRLLEHAIATPELATATK